MNDKKTAIVLGGTAPHIELLNNLKNRGYYTVLIDYYDNPPAKEYADEHIQESTLDEEKVLKVAKEKKANLVISACVDQANVVACRVSERLGFFVPYSSNNAAEIADKTVMKTKLKKINVPIAEFFEITSLNELGRLGFPVVVKPGEGNGSAGVRKANNDEELKRYIKDAFSISRNGKVIVEEYMEGEEISIDCFIEDHISKILLIRKKYIMNRDLDAVLQSPGSYAPAIISKEAMTKIQSIANTISSGFCLNNTPLLIQAIINGNNVRIIEFAPRIGGGLSYKTVSTLVGVDLVDTVINSFLNIDSKINVQMQPFYLSTNIIYAKPSILGEITGIQDLIQRGIIEEYYSYRKYGSEIFPGMSTKSRVGAFIVKANSIDNLKAKILESVSNIDVFDQNGQSIMRKDIYSQVCF